ncbi:MAG: hypothetical protein V1794_07885, partial [Candidatus Glassbacteria bacterium]
MLRELLALLSISALTLAACSGDSQTPTSSTERIAVKLEFTGLTPLGGGATYQAWALSGPYGLSLGKFNFDANGTMLDVAGNPVANNEFELSVPLSDVTDIAITVEPNNDSDINPSVSHLMGGTIANSAAVLTVGHETGVAVDFSTVSGKFVLATPTDGNNNNENSGLWFIDYSSSLSSKGLNLPALGGGWVYEGWVTINGTPVSTGRFLYANEADDSSRYGGPQEGPSFPGEDFLNNSPTGLTFPADLSGSTVAITVEPVVDDDPAPFPVKPLT